MGGIALLRMTRPFNALVAGAGVWCGALLVGAPFLPTMRLALAIVAAIAFAAAGNLRNDILDVDVDRVAHPARPLVTGAATAREAQTAAIACYLVALAAGFAASWRVGVVVLAALPLMEAYERALKRRGLVGNAAIGALSAAPFLVGALVFGLPDVPVLAVALLAALATMAREVLKDVEDMDADRGFRETWPLRVGARRAARTASSLLVATVLLSPLPFLRGNVLGWAYVPAVGLADAVFLGALVSGPSRPGRAQRLVKVGMVLAIAALVVGRWQGSGFA